MSLITESLLKSADPAEVLEGILKARQSESIKHLGTLLSLRESPVPAIAQGSAEAAGAILLNYLLSSSVKISPETRNEFVSLLRQLDPEAVEVLRREVKNPEIQNRIGRMQLLSVLDAPESSIKIMSTLAWDNDIKIRASAVKILGSLIDTKDLSKIIRFLYDNDHRVIANTIETLEEIGNQNILGILMRFRKHVNNRVRANALKALWNLGYHEIYADVLLMLQDAGELMRASATWLIGQVGHGAPEMVKLLELVVDDNSPMVKSNLVRAANTLATPEAKQILAKVKIDDVKKINMHARHRLHEVSLEKDPKTRATAVKILGPMLDPRDLNKVFAFLDDSNDRVVANTIEILEAIGGLRVLEFIERFRRHRNNRIRANALKALWRYGVHEIIGDLEVMLRDPKELMRASAVWVIGETGQDDFRLRNLLAIVERDKSEIVHRNLRKAKGKLGLDAAGSKSRDCVELVVEQVRVQLNHHPVLLEERGAVSKKTLLSEMGNILHDKEKILSALKHLEKQGLLAGVTDETEGELLTVPDPDLLDLFLDFRHDPVSSQAVLWSRMTADFLSLLAKIEVLIGSYGRIVENGGVLKTKFLFPEVNNDNLALDLAIADLEGLHLAATVLEEGERALRFDFGMVQRAKKAREWLPRFQ